MPSALADVVARIAAPDESAREAALQRQARLTKPTGALGRLEELSVWASGVQGRCPPQRFERVRVVSSPATTASRRPGCRRTRPRSPRRWWPTSSPAARRSTCSPAQTGASVRVVDMGVGVDVAGADARYKVCHGTGPIDTEDALDAEQLRGAFEAGVAIVDEEVDSGADLLIPGDMGIGSTTPCAAVTAALLGPAAGRRRPGAAPAWTTRPWLRKRARSVAAARARIGWSTDPLRVVGAIGGAESRR